MYFISAPSPNIFLMFGIIDQQFLGFGEQGGKLCIYKKAIYDNGQWKEFFLTDITILKCDSCENGLHVATGLYFDRYILIAARENKFTRIFELDMKKMELTRYKMLHETHPESELFNLNLCCSCVKPIVRGQNYDSGVYSFDITPQKYHNEVGIYRILISINNSEEHSLLWKKDDSFLLKHVPLSSNIYVDDEAQVVSVYKKREEDGIIEELAIDSKDGQCTVDMTNMEKDRIYHESAFSALSGLYLTRGKENDDGRIILRLYHFKPSVRAPSTSFTQVDYCIIDANFPSLVSVHFFVYWRGVDEDYIPKRSGSVCFESTKNWAVPSCIYFQLADGSTVTIPLEVLSLSQLAYIALSRIPQPSQQQQCPLPVAKISLMYYFFQRIRNLCGESKKEEDVSTKGFFHKEVDDEDVWMSQEFIKKKIGWPRIFPLIKAPILPKKSE